MGVDGSYTFTVAYRETLKLEVPIMSMIMLLNSAIYVEEGGFNIMEETARNTVLATNTTCVIRSGGFFEMHK